MQGQDGMDGENGKDGDIGPPVRTEHGSTVATNNTVEGHTLCGY